MVEVFIELVTILFLFYVVVFFGLKACGILIPDQGPNPHPCIGRQSSNHGTSREVPQMILFNSYTSFVRQDQNEAEA